ncbi:MAG: hypothetical protein ACE5GH_02955 [Fidelibacterota bacterium]
MSDLTDHNLSEEGKVTGARQRGKGRKVRPKLKLYHSPLYLLAIVAFSVILVECVVMYAIHSSYLPTLSHSVEGIFDSLLLLILIFPVLYFFLFRPMLLHTAERKLVEEELRENKERYQRLFQQRQ